MSLGFSKSVVRALDVRGKNYEGNHLIRILGTATAQAGTKPAARSGVARRRAKSPPSFHSIERSTWSEATKEPILGREPKSSQLRGAGSV